MVVIGIGNSGGDIAVELSKHADKVCTTHLPCDSNNSIVCPTVKTRDDEDESLVDKEHNHKS